MVIRSTDDALYRLIDLGSVDRWIRLWIDE